MYDSDIQSFVQCEVVKKHTQAVLYVASDSAEAKKAVEEASVNRVVTSSTIARHSNAAMRRDKNVDILTDAFIDMLTVASCDYVVGTWKSSFSVVAGAFQGKMPYFVKPWKKCVIPQSLGY